MRRFAAFRATMTTGLAVLIACAGLGLGTVGARAEAVELVMFRTATCIWCAAWDREVGVIYGRTAEGRAAPVRMVDMDTPLPPDLASLDPVRFTPTFVVMSGSREVGRILGYPGEDHFWGLLGSLLKDATQPHAENRTAERTIQ